MPLIKLFGFIPLLSLEEPTAPGDDASVTPVTVQPQPQTTEEDPQKVHARLMLEDSKWAAAQLAEASVELSNERRLMEAHRRREEAKKLREQRTAVRTPVTELRDRRDDGRRNPRRQDSDDHYDAGYQAGLQGHAQTPGTRTGPPHRRYTAGWNTGDRERRQQGVDQEGPAGDPGADL